MAFTFTLGYCRASVSIAAVDQKLGTLLRMHEGAFHQFGGFPKEILSDRMKRACWEPTTRRDRVDSAVSGVSRYWVRAAAVPALSGADQRQGGIGREIRAAEFPVWTARA